MNYTITGAASPSKFSVPAGSGSTIYRAKILTTAPDIAISVAGDEIRTFVDSIEVTGGQQLSLVDDHREQVLAAVTPLLDGFTSATIFGRWITAGLMEPYAIERVDPLGRTKLQGYDLSIFKHDEDPMTGYEVSFTDEDGEQIMSVLMSLTEDRLVFDETAALRSKGWPVGFFWFSEDQEHCLAYRAIGHRAFSETRYARIAEEVEKARRQAVKRATDVRAQGVANM
ncbi:MULTISPECIES: hypothetical protein [unclassified Ensifer]|uniref:hypothetical protein n=1 Tax=unclassified Ensifer TaxID=2633371 RepID=UPI00070CF999|nr:MULTISPECIES: hypothetical protein [unclassified Ensifer]KQW33515.1 hypothetical protein ASD02_18905 [Ensifer sp. Root1252]KRC78689.1 hypothetical protein ASE32_26875 [Ensifer sp. Root231]KRD02592.1 hypothetical protein ASE47_19965 [Ensifer sp. Root258]